MRGYFKENFQGPLFQETWIFKKDFFSRAIGSINVDILKEFSLKTFSLLFQGRWVQKLLITFFEKWRTFGSTNMDILNNFLNELWFNKRGFFSGPWIQIPQKNRFFCSTGSWNTFYLKNTFVEQKVLEKNPILLNQRFLKKIQSIF